MFNHVFISAVLAATVAVVRASSQITLRNNCGFGVGMYISSYPGSNNGINYSGNPVVDIGAGQSTTITVPTSWNGRICDTPPNSGCQNNCFGGIAFGEASCSMTEFTFDSNGLDYYDVSNIQGYSVPMTIIPSVGSCETKTCNNVNCPCNEAYRPNDTTGTCGGTGPIDQAVATCGTNSAYTVQYC